MDDMSPRPCMRNQNEQYVAEKDRNNGRTARKARRIHDRAFRMMSQYGMRAINEFGNAAHIPNSRGEDRAFYARKATVTPSSSRRSPSHLQCHVRPAPFRLVRQDGGEVLIFSASTHILDGSIA